MKAVIFVLIGSTLAGVAFLSLPRLALQWTRWTSPEVVFSVPVEERVVALTIDDGPSSATSAILDVLEEHGARATFFLVGEHLESHPDIARRLVAAEHEMGHHMMEDRPSRRLPEDVFEARFDAADRLLDELGGSRLFRPGSGWYDERMVRVAEKRGYRTVLGSLYPFDTIVSAPGLLSWYILKSAVPGSILILHDGPERGLRTAEVLRTVLPKLERRGYEVVTVSSLLALADDADDGGDGSADRPSASPGEPVTTPAGPP